MARGRSPVVPVLLAAGVVGVGLFAVEKLSDWDPWPDFSAPDIELPNPFNFGGNDDYTSNVEGGIGDIAITPHTWPLFEYPVKLDPLELYKGGDLDYAERSVQQAMTSMTGRLVAVDLVDETGVEQTYITAIDDKGTDDPTDDRLTAININNFDMSTAVGVNEHTYGKDDSQAYSNCVAQLNAGNSEFQGCRMVGLDGKDADVPTIVLDNLRAQHVGNDKCTVETLAIASNVVMGGVVDTFEWKKTGPDTVTVGDVAANSLEQRVADLKGVPVENVHAVMEVDGNGNAVQWELGDSDSIDLSKVKELSDGQYNPPDVSVSSYCLRFPWNTKATVEERVQVIRSEVGEQMVSPDWLASMQYQQVDIPAELEQVTFNADGTITTMEQEVIPIGSSLEED